MTDDDLMGTASIRRAVAADAEALTAVDSVALAGSPQRATAIREWCERGLAHLAADASGPIGYGVLEYTFFEQGFVSMLMVAPAARGRGVGGLLLAALERECTTEKLYTSTNTSNLRMRRLLDAEGWQAAGFVEGLDEGDPELFYRCPRTTARPAV
ncbi:GNAT family N-acetyltransferase [Streptomyces sp. NPDC001941]|uniref:GNAT family N-acetyltransferase n=1 Tax=Streptomyces sp. NPDC001941 TaxID=3154659 RepID=UPI00332A0F8F